jgi:tetratricopeptide (TPR) repeat protein
MDGAQPATRGQRTFRALASLLLFPVDLARLTGLFLSLTVRFAYRTYLCVLWGLPRPTIEFYPCRPRQAPVEWDNRKRFVVRRTMTLRLLRLYCGRQDIELEIVVAEDRKSSAVNLTARQYLRMALGLGLTWVLAVGAPVATWKTAAHVARSGDLAAEFKRDADALFEKEAFDRARIQYLNAIQQRSSDVAAQWGLAQCALELEYFQEARKALERVVSIDGSHRPARAALVDLLLRQGKAAEAIEHASEAAEQDPADVDAVVRLGKCQQSLGRRSEARRQAEAALKLSPDHRAALMFAAAVAADDGDCATARQRVERAMETIPAAELDRLVVARILGKCGDYAAARAQLEKLLAREPANRAAAQDLAEMLLAGGDVDAAIGAYRKLAQTAAGGASIEIRLAELLLAAGRLDEAHAAGESMVRQMPRDKAGHLVLAMVYYLKGLWIASAEHCRLSLEIEPKSVPARTLLARVLMRQKNYREAVLWLKPLQVEDWGNLEIRLMLAECQVEQDDRKAAFELLDSIQAMNPTSDAPHLLLARLHVAAGERGKAVAAYRKALELNPRQPVALNNLASLLSADGAGDETQLQEAQALATEAWSLRPDNPEIAETLGWIQALRGEYSSAVSLLSYSARMLLRQPQIRYHLAYAFAGLNRLEDAAKQLDLAVELEPAYTDRKEVQALRERLGRPQAEGPGGP